MNIEQIVTRISNTAKSMDQICRAAPDWRRGVEASYMAAGELRTLAELVFPEEAGIHLLKSSLARRQVWWGVLSALEPADVTDAEMLRHNLLLLADDTLLAARFGTEKGRALKPLLHALSPRPLGKAQYDVLAALIVEEAETLEGWIARDGFLDAYKLREYLFPDVATMNAVLAEDAAG
ncbi:hypothetical protein [Roseinatronobacter monicus]|uniref:Uncharacterized protein n=1 Tax=Roseinatronobacter monicus TaxID=393481 RepID=A0A543KBF8_9RHOB|nr:hypothetical protein [Roseinatronobacter monicus]TQM92410.1 hypothetical protein BD293_1015 [Roseinatronobacter monicus]